MNSTQKEITYNTTNSYSTLNKLTHKTTTIWFACHGMGQLSKRFISHFSGLDQVENYIIAPQAPSKYYHSKSYATVGASWLTKMDTKRDTENIMNYFDSIFQNEDLPKSLNFNFLGYSQGVSVVMRYLASRKLHFKNLILFAGGIPIELESSDFNFIQKDSKIFFLYGDKDEYLNETRIASEKNHLEMLFQNRYRVEKFSGTHSFQLEPIMDLL